MKQITLFEIMEEIMTGLSAQSFAEDSVLLHELYHRVNNEFASAIGLLSLTAARSHNDEVKTVVYRVTEMLRYYADVHRALQMPEDDRLIDAAAYLTQLCLSISRSKLDGMKIKLLLSVENLRLPTKRCWPLGMILYELITNAARHAFDGSGGEIRVVVWCDRAFVKCSVQDNGMAAPSIQPGRGLKIVDTLIKTLGGNIKQTFGPRGSKSLMTFPRSRKPSVVAGNARNATGAKPQARYANFRPSFEGHEVL